MVNGKRARRLGGEKASKSEARRPIPLTPHALPRGVFGSTRLGRVPCGLTPRGERLTLDSGFTLVEILVAMAIFAIAVLGLAIGATSVMRANQTSYFNTVATNLAQDKLEQFKATAVASLPACPVYTTSDPNCFDNQTSLGLTFTRSWQIIANSPVAGVSRLDVKIDWTDYISHSITISSAVR